MDEQNREALAADILRSMKLFCRNTLDADRIAKIIAAGTDQGKHREIASESASYQLLAQARDWEEGMTTNPGDMVWDPDRNYRYIYTGDTPYQHTNPLYYPGAAGVYFWAVIPKIKDFIKIYPDIEGIVVAVKKGETWWNTDMTQRFIWVGDDNNNCVWPPEEGDVWQAVTEA